MCMCYSHAFSYLFHMPRSYIISSVWIIACLLSGLFLFCSVNKRVILNEKKNNRHIRNPPQILQKQKQNREKAEDFSNPSVCLSALWHCCSFCDIFSRSLHFCDILYVCNDAFLIFT